MSWSPGAPRNPQDGALRIALVTRRYPPLVGGAERVLSYLAPALQTAGAHVWVVTSDIPGLDVKDCNDNTDLKTRDASIVRLPTARMRMAGTWLYMRALRKWLSLYAPDVIYVSMLKHDAYVAVGQKRHNTSRPLVVLRPEGAGATGDLAWQRWGRFGRTIARRCRRADAFVAISPAIRRELEADGYDARNIYDLPNGVPIPSHPWQPPDPNAFPGAVFTGRLAPEKNLAVLLDAWSLVRARYPLAQLTLVGDGPERPALIDQAQRLGLSVARGTDTDLEPHAAVRFTGFVTETEPWLRRAGVFVLPSREEGMSVALLEAMALGIPAVASDIPGNRGLIADGVEGLLFPVSDAHALSAAIERCVRDPAALIRAERARALVRETYSIAAVAKAHLRLFEERLSQREKEDEKTQTCGHSPI